MEQQGIPGGPINTIAEAFSSSQTKARDMLVTLPYQHAASGSVELIGNPIKFSKTPITYNRPPPVCGEHTDEVLAEWLGISGKQTNEGN